MRKWARAMYQPNLPLKETCRVTAGEEHIRLAEEAAKEGMVLLKNDRKLLPLSENARIALFGKGSIDYVKGGGGSGDVLASPVYNLYDGIRLRERKVQIYEPLAEFYRENVAGQYQAGSVPGMTREPKLTETLLHGARDFTDTAIIVISRFSGEGWDRSDDFYLSEEEKLMVHQVEALFDRIAVVLNIGGVIDTSWIKESTAIASALVAWQGGMTGGLAISEVLFGRTNPSGRLADTFAASLEDYPSTDTFHESVDYVDYTEDIYVGYRYFETIPDAASRVVYPFGHGLSYTQFSLKILDMKQEDDEIKSLLMVTNTGEVSGKDVIQVYYSAPQGQLKEPARELAAFAKTGLLQPGESEQISLSFSLADMASYDDLGKIAKSAWVLEAGIYQFYIGASVRENQKAAFELEIQKDTVVEQLSAKMVPTDLKKRLLSDGTFEALPLGETNDMNACIFEKMTPGTEEGIVPEVRAYPRRQLAHPYKESAKMLEQVANGEIDMNAFLEQLS
ncbi:MAG: glycoside hydrolase family 3 C-terminal domain-containing protein, partial [Lachnospiraceae bacterium]|nr:glycoside hydrolase family 3 C-terminal domain-containing protein [Lachnospiraceae bacterium]